MVSNTIPLTHSLGICEYTRYSNRDRRGPTTKVIILAFSLKNGFINSFIISLIRNVTNPGFYDLVAHIENYPLVKCGVSEDPCEESHRGIYKSIFKLIIQKGILYQNGYLCRRLPSTPIWVPEKPRSALN